MARIVCVHGVGQQLIGPETIASEWIAPLRDGLRAAGARPEELPSGDDVAVAFFGELFRGRKAAGNAPFNLADIEEGFEAELLLALASNANVNQTEHETQPMPKKAGWTPTLVQRAAVSLLRVKFFSAMTERMLVGSLKQVRWYLTDFQKRNQARERLARELTGETRVVIGHSLGSIVSYEVLCRAEQPIAPAFISLGSPLGWPNLIFDRLDPPPRDARGRWPPTITSWTNVADVHDIVAAVKRLSPLFEGRIDDVEVDNEALAHDVRPYLTAPQTGAAILKALRGC